MLGEEPCDRTAGSFKFRVLVNATREKSDCASAGPAIPHRKVLLRAADLGRDAGGQRRSTAAHVHALIWPGWCVWVRAWEPLPPLLRFPSLLPA